LNDILLFRTGGHSIDSNWRNTLVENTIAYLLESRVSLLTPYLIEWMILLLSLAGERPEHAATITRLRIIEKMVGILIAHKYNNILSCRIVEALKIVLSSLETEVMFSINHHKDKDPSQITFPLFDAFFEQLPRLFE
jgi:hypothetical protein